MFFVTSWFNSFQFECYRHALCLQRTNSIFSILLPPNRTMSERERWVVYPLLFLALGASLRDKFADRTMSKSIICQELILVDEDATGEQPMRVLARLGPTKSAEGELPRGELELDGPLKVNGLVNANNYAYRDVPIVPAFQPGITLENLLRALQGAARPQQSQNIEQPQPETQKAPPDDGA